MRFYLIGETGMLVQCARIVQQRGHEIIGVISRDSRIRDFFSKMSINNYPSLEKASSDIKAVSFDYLFSIVNYEVLPKWILQKPKCLSINYHDAPLPKYAGVHATSWAILNRENKHGISWHIMHEKVDAGDILKQAIFPINQNDTAFTLNKRCFEHATIEFENLINDIENNSVERCPQDLSQRTYFGFAQKPLGNGAINWDQTANNIDRLYRALDFGNVVNNFSKLKIMLNESKELYPKKIKIIENSQNDIPPGTVVKLNENELVVACKDGLVIATELSTNSSNEKTPLAQLTSLYNLREKQQLPLIV